MQKRVTAIITAGFFTLFVAFAIRYAYGLVLPYMLSALKISKAQAGVIFSSYFIAATMLSPMIGVLIDRFDARIILSVFVAILGVGACLMSVSSSVVQASIFFAITGIGHSACWAPVVAVVMRWVSPKRRGIAISVVDLGTTAGIACWSILVPIIIRDHTWRTVWLSLGISALVVAGMNFFLINSRPQTEVGTVDPVYAQKVEVSAHGSYRDIFRDRRFYLISFSYLFISFSVIIPFTFLITYATQRLMIPYASATGLLFVMAAIGAVGKLILAHISDRAGRISIMILCGLLTASGSLGMGYARELSTLYIFSALFGIGYGTLWAVYAASARDLFPGEHSGSIIGLWTVFHGVGSIIAPVFSGWTIDASGNYYYAFILAASASVLSALLLLPVRNKARVPQ
ncbi:MAG: nitrate/nitrite transporter [Syntrophorhabdus sp.]